MAQVQFHFLDVSGAFLKDRRRLKDFLRYICELEKKDLKSLHYIFCSDEQLLEMNRAHLSHDFYTDVIGFDLSENGRNIEAEIYISVDRVKENALQLQVVFKAELLRVIIHGLLHFCGYQDKTPSQKRKMRSKEDIYIDAHQLFHVKR